MATVDELVVKIRADTAQLERSLKRVRDELDKTGRGPGGAGGGGRGRRGGVFAGIGLALSAIPGPAVAAAVAMGSFGVAVKSIASVGSEFEDLRDSLNSVFGSARAGELAFKNIQKVAQTTPFQIETLSKAFISLRSSGITPTDKMMQVFADTASNAVDSVGAFEAMVRVTQRSLGGGLGLEELEQLSDRGIPVYDILFEKLKITRGQISEVGKTAAGAKKIMDALMLGLEERMGGSMANKMDNLSTKVSNMAIAFKGLADTIFTDTGLAAGLKVSTDFMTEMANSASNFIKSIGSAADADFFGKGPEERVAHLQDMIRNLKALTPKEAMGGLAFFATEKEEQKEFDERLARLQALLVVAKADVQAMKDGAEAASESAKKKAAAIAASEEQLKVQKKLKGLIKDSVPLSKQLREELDFLTQMLDKVGTEGFEAFSEADIRQAIVKTREELDALNDEALDVADTFGQQLEQAIVNLSTTFTSNFVGALLSGQDALQSFKNFAVNIVNAVITKFLQLKVVEPLLNAIFNAIPGMGANAGNVPTSQSSASAVNVANRVVSGTELVPRIVWPKATSSPISQAPAMSRASAPALSIPPVEVNILSIPPVEVNIPSIPPVEVPTVILNMPSVKAPEAPARMMSRASAPVVINQSLNFSTGVVPTVRAEVTRMLPQISDVTKASVLEAASRGGSFQRGLVGA